MELFFFRLSRHLGVLRTNSHVLTCLLGTEGRILFWKSHAGVHGSESGGRNATQTVDYYYLICLHGEMFTRIFFFFVNVIKREFLFLILVGETFSPTVSCDEWRLLPRHFFFLCAMTWKGD